MNFEPHLIEQSNFRERAAKNVMDVRFYLGRKFHHLRLSAKKNNICINGTKHFARTVFYTSVILTIATIYFAFLCLGDKTMFYLPPRSYEEYGLYEKQFAHYVGKPVAGLTVSALVCVPSALIMLACLSIYKRCIKPTFNLPL